MEVAKEFKELFLSPYNALVSPVLTVIMYLALFSIGKSKSNTFKVTGKASVPSSLILITILDLYIPLLRDKYDNKGKFFYSELVKVHNKETYRSEITDFDNLSFVAYGAFGSEHFFCTSQVLVQSIDLRDYIFPGMFKYHRNG